VNRPFSESAKVSLEFSQHHTDSVDALDAKRDQLRESATSTLRELRHTIDDAVTELKE